MELHGIPTKLIRPNPNQPRKAFEKDGLEELAASIKEHGLVQPIVVRKAGKFYEIIAGERRWRAYQIAGIDEVPAIVKDLQPNETLLESLLENINREDLTPIEREDAVAELWNSGNYKSYEEVGKQLGKRGNEAIGFVKRHVVAKGLRDRFGVPATLSTQHLFEISQLDDAKDQKAAIDRVVNDNLSVHQMRAFVQTLKSAPASIKQAVFKGSVDLEDVRKLVERGATDLPDEHAGALLEELETLKDEKELMKREAEAIVSETLQEVERAAKSGKERQITIDKRREELERDERIYRRSVEAVYDLVHGWHIDYDRMTTDRWKKVFMHRLDIIDRMIHEFIKRKGGLRE